MNFKGTKTDWHAIEFAGIIILKDSEFYEGKNILDYDDVGKEVADANAKLAISAPVLLKALQKIVEMNRQHANDEYGDPEKAESWSCVQIAREAINKALS